jgi:Skp family chaperone for outer membrane proteins
MGENIKNQIILILAVVTIIFFIIALGSCSNAGRLKNARDKEMSARLDLEEKMSKFSQEKTGLQEELKGKEKELQEEKATHEASKKALVQEQLVNQSLNEELAKVTKLKETLEEDLKEALVSGKSTKTKR